MDKCVRDTGKGVGSLRNTEIIQASGKVHPPFKQQVALDQSQIGWWQAGAVQRRTRLHPGMIVLVWVWGVGVQKPSCGFPR